MQHVDMLVISLCCEANGVMQCLDILVRLGKGYILQAASLVQTSVQTPCYVSLKGVKTWFCLLDLACTCKLRA
jgi:hypothetical protein